MFADSPNGTGGLSTLAGRPTGRESRSKMLQSAEPHFWMIDRDHDDLSRLTGGAASDLDVPEVDQNLDPSWSPQGLGASAATYTNSRARFYSLIRKRVWSDLEVNHFAGCSLGGFAVEGRSSAPGRPDPLSFPPRLRIVDSAVHPFGKKAKRIRNAHDDEFPVHESE